MNENIFGVIDFWHVEKNFGFISGEDGVSYFFHVTGLHDPTALPRAGDGVRFNVEPGERGPKAISVAFTEGVNVENEISLLNSRTPTLNVSVAECTKELLKHLQTHPEDLYTIHPKMFEQVVAAIFKNEGFNTELIGSWNQPDGGVDLIAVRKLVDGIRFGSRYSAKDMPGNDI